MTKVTNRFKPGDIVVLKSGSPKMTLNSVISGSDYRCVWFKGATHQSAIYNDAALDIYKDDTPK